MKGQLSWGIQSKIQFTSLVICIMELESNLFVKVLNFCCMGLFLPIFWFQKFDGFF
jgi:hypothetical protein